MRRAGSSEKVVPTNVVSGSDIIGRKEAIMGLDLEPICRKLMMDPPEGKGWTQEQAALGEVWYKRFLVLALLHPDHTAVPNGPIDEMWHMHILDTERYGSDCERLLGRMLHHFPYFGLRGDDDAVARDATFDRTNELYRLEFGEDCTVLGTSGVFAAAEDGRGCNHSGSGTGCGQRAQSCNSAGSGTGCSQL